VDLLSGREVVITEGSLIDAMLATMSVPGLFTPVARSAMQLVDGGILNNVPAEEARALGGDIVVAVDVLPDLSANQPGRDRTVEPIDLSPLPAIVRNLVESNHIMMSALTELRLQKARPEVVVRPQIPRDITVLYGFHRPDECIDAGEEAARRALPEILRALEDR
jgi:NTE family protein